MFIGDMAPTNIRDYVHRFHIIDEYIGPKGRPTAVAWPIYALINRQI
jgi:hypothetical protein